MEAAEWGNVPWLPGHWAPTDDHVARQEINSGDQPRMEHGPNTDEMQN